MACSRCRNPQHNIASCPFGSRFNIHQVTKYIQKKFPLDGSFLVHLYKDSPIDYTLEYFEENVIAGKDDWKFRATPGHGIGNTKTKVLNCFSVNRTFIEGLNTNDRDIFAALVLFEREKVEDNRNLTVVDVITVNNPNDIDDEEWMFDSRWHRRMLGSLGYGQVVRIKPQQSRATFRVPFDFACRWE